MGVALGRGVPSSLLRTIWCLYDRSQSLVHIEGTKHDFMLHENPKKRTSKQQHVITKIMMKNGALLVQVTLHFELEAAAVLQQVVSNAANRV